MNPTPPASDGSAVPSVVISVDLDGDDTERASEIYDAIEGLLFRMGEIGTLSMRGRDGWNAALAAQAPDLEYKSFSEAMSEAASKPVTDELRRVHQAYVDNQRRAGAPPQPGDAEDFNTYPNVSAKAREAADRQAAQPGNAERQMLTAEHMGREGRE